MLDSAESTVGVRVGEATKLWKPSKIARRMVQQ